MTTQLTHNENKPTVTPAAEQKRANRKGTDIAVKEQPLTESILQRQSLTTTPGNLPPPNGSGQDDSLITHSLFNSLHIQPKLTIGQPDDIYEQEADRVADQVMRVPEPAIMQRQCVGCEEEPQIQCKPWIQTYTPSIQHQSEEEEEVQEKPDIQLLTNENKLIQKTAQNDNNSNSEVSLSLESRINSMRGGGQLLSESDRAFFEPRFGVDFRNVRVHNDSKASETAECINAKAFTVGNDIIFRKGMYSPASSEGRKLIGHELAHVKQQAAFSSSNYINNSIIQRQIALKVVRYNGYDMFPPQWHIDRARSIYSHSCGINVTSEMIEDYSQNTDSNQTNTRQDLGDDSVFDFPDDVRKAKTRSGASGTSQVPLIFARDIRVNGGSGYAGYTDDGLAAVCNRARRRHIGAREIARFFGLTGTNGDIDNLLYERPNSTNAPNNLTQDQCSRINQRMGGGGHEAMEESGEGTGCGSVAAGRRPRMPWLNIFSGLLPMRIQRTPSGLIQRVFQEVPGTAVGATFERRRNIIEVIMPWSIEEQEIMNNVFGALRSGVSRRRPWNRESWVEDFRSSLYSYLTEIHHPVISHGTMQLTNPQGGNSLVLYLNLIFSDRQRVGRVALFIPGGNEDLAEESDTTEVESQVAVEPSSNDATGEETLTYNEQVERLIVEYRSRASTPYEA